MPEIAEVRIIADRVTEMLSNAVINSIELLTNYKGLSGYDKLALPQPVKGVFTRGKFTWILLEDGSAICYGLGMSGDITPEPGKHAHLRVNYNTDQRLYYHDVRRFGRWECLTPAELTRKLASLGSDLLQETLNGEEIIKLFRKKDRTNICKVLMDQNIVAGIGNYLKAEALYAAKVYPLARVGDLPDSALIDIYYSAKNVAQKVYDAGASYRSNAQLLIYGKAVDPLGNSVITISDNISPDKRTTHWVPVIQTIGLPIVKNVLRQ